MEEKLRMLKLRKAELFNQMTMLSEISDSFYLKFGKLESEIMFLEKEIIRKTENITDDTGT